MIVTGRYEEVHKEDEGKGREEGTRTTWNLLIHVHKEVLGTYGRGTRHQG